MDSLQQQDAPSFLNNQRKHKNTRIIALTAGIPKDEVHYNQLLAHCQNPMKAAMERGI